MTSGRRDSERRVRDVEYLRVVRPDFVEKVRQSGRYTAADRSNALDVLGHAVRIMRHPYAADPHSGSGNCWCARPLLHDLHDVIVIEERAR